MEHKLRRLDRKLAYKGGVLTFYRDTMELPDGKIEQWDFIDHPRGGACIVPVLPDGRILMIRQMRPAIDRETLELPAGARDSRTEDTADTAARELREETGYTSDKISPLIKLKTAVAYCSEFTDVYLAEDLVPADGQHLDEAEEINVEAFPLEILTEKIYAGETKYEKTVACIMKKKKKIGRDSSKD